MKTLLLTLLLVMSFSLSAKKVKIRACDIVKFETVWTASSNEVKHYLIVKNSSRTATTYQFVNDKERFNTYCKWAGGRTPRIVINVK